MLRGQIAYIVSGSVFLFIGLATVSIATIRINRRGARISPWLGIWSATYGAVQLTDLPSVVAVAPHWLQIMAPFVNTALTYLLVVPASLAFLELSLGGLRRVLQAGL